MKIKGREFWKAKSKRKTYYICNIFCDLDLAEKSIKAYLHDPVIREVGYVVGDQLTIVKKFDDFFGDSPKDAYFQFVWVFSRR